MAKCPTCGKETDDISIRKKIAPGDVLIISKQGDYFLIAENKNNDVRIRRIKIEEYEKEANKKEEK